MGAIAVVLFALIWLWAWATIKNQTPIRNWPLLGMLPGLLSNASRIHDYLTHILDQSNQTIEFKGPKFLSLNFIVTSDPKNIHYIMSTKFHTFNKGADFKEIFEALGDGIMAADSDSWKMQRRLTHSLFKQRNFLSLLEATVRQKVQDGLFKFLDHASESGIEVEMQDLCQRFTFDVTCIYMFGSDLNSLSEGLPEIPFAKALDDYEEEVILHRHLKPRRMWRLQKWVQVGVGKRRARHEGGTKEVKNQQKLSMIIDQSRTQSTGI